jgi:hypothetical protein
MDKRIFVSIILMIEIIIVFLGISIAQASSLHDSNLNSKLIGIDGTPIFYNQTINLTEKYGIKSGKELQALQTKGMATSYMAASYKEGDKVEFWSADNLYASDKVDNDGDGLIDEPDEYMYKLNATLKKVANHAYIFVEDGQTVSNADINHVANEFDNTIYPNDTNTFGSEPDVDGDPKIFILLLNIRDKNYHDPTYPFYIAGYFQSYQETTEPYSNHKDMIYIDVNPGNPGTSEYTIAHEFQHMIHWNQDADEELWINEGLADYAEYVCYKYHEMGHVDAFKKAPSGQFSA